MATINHTISVSPEFHQLMENERLSWSEAARVGAAVLLSERNVIDSHISERIGVFAKIKKLQSIIKEQGSEMEKLQELVKNAN